jgi:hypothetical protein
LQDTRRALQQAILQCDKRAPTKADALDSLPRLFFDYLGQGFELGAKPIEMLFVSFVVIKQFR